MLDEGADRRQGRRFREHYRRINTPLQERYPECPEDRGRIALRQRIESKICCLESGGSRPNLPRNVEVDVDGQRWGGRKRNRRSTRPLESPSAAQFAETAGLLIQNSAQSLVYYLVGNSDVCVILKILSTKVKLRGNKIFLVLDPPTIDGPRCGERKMWRGIFFVPASPRISVLVIEISGAPS